LDRGNKGGRESFPAQLEFGSTLIGFPRGKGFGTVKKVISPFIDRLDECEQTANSHGVPETWAG